METKEQDQVQAMILDAINNHGAEPVIKALAECCRVMARGAIAQKKWTQAGTYNHYACSLLELLGDSEDA